MGKIDIMRSAVKYCFDSRYRFLINANLFHKYDSMPDDMFLKRKYEAALKRKINLDYPERFNDKLQWLKLNDRRDEYTLMVDKHAVKEFISDIIGEKYIIPTLGVWDDPEKIDFDLLPNRFVLKCNHNSGLGMCICKDKSKLDIQKVKKELRKGLEQDYYLTGREWPYKNVSRKIIAEQYISDGTNSLTDYKVHNFNGVPKFILVCKDRFSESGLTEDFFSPEWEHLSVKRPGVSQSLKPISEPDELKEILDISAKLSQNIPFLRADFYIVDHKIYFSELTFFPASGFDAFEPDEWDFTFGSWLQLPNSNNCK